MRFAARLVWLSLFASLLPLMAAGGAAYLMATRTEMSAFQVFQASAGAGLVTAILCLPFAIGSGRHLERDLRGDHESGRFVAREVLARLQGSVSAEDERLRARAFEPSVMEEQTSDEVISWRAPGAETSSAPADMAVLERLAAVLADEMASSGRPVGHELRRFLQFACPSPIRRRLVNLNGAVDVCVRAMQQAGLHARGTASISFDPDPNVGELRVDPDGLHQVLVNLIANAREAAGPRGHVELRTQAMGDMVLVAVRDDGPGVRAGDMERIFEPFYSTRKSALGLGLPICRRIAEAHGGTITAVNILPQGLEVGVSLPAS